MAQMTPSNFRPLQSGDDIRVRFDDGAEIDGTFRRYSEENQALVLTQPAGENDPALQTTRVIKDYASVIRPIPSTDPNGVPSDLIGTTVDLYYRDNSAGSGAISSPVTGTLLSIDLNSGLVTLDVSGTEYVFRDYYYFEQVP